MTGMRTKQGDSLLDGRIGASLCVHPVEARTLHYGLEVLCRSCNEIVAIVAPLDQAIIGPAEARWLLGLFAFDRENLKQHPAIVKLLASAGAK